MALERIDWLVFGIYGLLTLGLGLWAARRARSAGEFFVGGRHMPWWLLGTSMVATTFSTDTPNLVTDITRQQGVAGNWVWWAFLLTGMLTAFVYAGMWRRTGITTDLEFYELRYSGPAASFLRGFRAIYLGVLFNVMVMASVTLAAIKIGGVLLGTSPVQTVALGGALALAISLTGGLASVVWTDMLLFFVAMVGAVTSAIWALRHPDVGGLSALMERAAVTDKLALIPDLTDPAAFIPILVVPLAVQWWASWYPGSEPGGGGYAAQRMLAARNEDHATGAAFFFNVAHYALRPWPWILVALASLVVFPDLDSLRRAFPQIDQQIIGHDLAYPAMLTFLPNGLLGLVVGSLVAAYVSTISTHLNWGSSYIAHDLYRRFVRPEATERDLLRIGRWSTLALMVAAAMFALILDNALQAFQILLQIGAGTGLLFILRWFWWRINAWSELVAMIASFAVALLFAFTGLGAGLESWQQLVIGVAVTTVAWITATFVAPPTNPDTLRSFVRLVRPGGPGWRTFVTADEPVPAWTVPGRLLCMILGCVAVYSFLFATGMMLYGRWPAAALCLLVGCAASWTLRRQWQTIHSAAA